ncbi:unnamed protein product [Durusdinium trenchii]|uniref:Uncharacterized protein n=1 Tax=Durusdinium trenchii TaxID=1381693 RepID=A0ABP0INN7_9DINO
MALSAEMLQGLKGSHTAEASDDLTEVSELIAGPAEVSPGVDWSQLLSQIAQMSTFLPEAPETEGPHAEGRRKKTALPALSREFWGSNPCGLSTVKTSKWRVE